MSVAAIGLIVQNLKHLIEYNADLIFGVKDQVASLYDDLQLLNAALKDFTNKPSNYEIAIVWVRLIRDVGFEMEDAIDKYVVLAALHKAKSRSRKAFRTIYKYPAELREAGIAIQNVRSKLNGYQKKMFTNEVLQLIYRTTEVMQVGEFSTSSSPVEVVGFDMEVKMLVDRLTGASNDLEVISVVGMGGTGKTALATKVLNDPSISPVFNPCALIKVSQKYDRKKLFLGILSLVTRLTEEMDRMSEDMLAKDLQRRLQDRRYLIVLDDVWSKKAWDELIIAFPRNKNRSRIMLTSRITNVAIYANGDSPPHHLRFLNDDECWELLRRKVFGSAGCPSEEMEDLGKKIAEKCHGLPLAVQVISESLSNDKNPGWWKTVAANVSRYVAKEPERCMNILALSYNKLTPHLKDCFIYFAVFPPDSIIPTWKLRLLWVAEGFMQELEQECLVDKADECLDDLVNANLIIVAKRKSINGGIKACRIQNTLRDFCLSVAAGEIFFRELRQNEQIPQPNYYRRLSMCSNVFNFISSQLSVTNVHSFFCFGIEQWVLPQENTSFIFKAFKLPMKKLCALQERESPLEVTSHFFEAFQLLRVLYMSISFTRFPSDMTNLVHLKLTALFGNIGVVPASISRLRNLQTLIVETTAQILDVHENIWELTQLTDVRTNRPCHFHEPPAKALKKNQLARKGLQTLSLLLPDSCTEHILTRALDVKKLGICGKLVALVEENGGCSMFDNLTKLPHLETLKLLNDKLLCPSGNAILQCFPQMDKFPPNLIKLTLSNTSLDWKHMTTLGKLPNLEVLKLRDNAFVGELWKVCDGGFRRLRILQLEKTNLEFWEAFDHHFPSLQRLILKQCKFLQEIPSALGDISALQLLELHDTSSSAADILGECCPNQDGIPSRRLQNKKQACHFF
ncbi:hypothetical protein F0562_034527 [Nyssa sinensis]|uniref:NB-ARC domain-containing protein n=1 Tax=Nyssa sinensis TaxID=561372 RepID=A0A5J5AI27_9ASTE|nr:hypothetical protein F0562_034527 [Nyssa sinensis]